MQVPSASIILMTPFSDPDMKDTLHEVNHNKEEQCYRNQHGQKTAFSGNTVFVVLVGDQAISLLILHSYMICCALFMAGLIVCTLHSTTFPNELHKNIFQQDTVLVSSMRSLIRLGNLMLLKHLKLKVETLTPTLIISCTTT